MTSCAPIPILDGDYLGKWLDEWGVRERFERIVRRNRSC